MGVTYRLVGFDAAETGSLTQGPARLRPAATLRLRSIITGGRLNLSASYGPTGRGKPNMAGCAAAALTMFRTATETKMTPDTPFANGRPAFVLTLGGVALELRGRR